MSKKPIKQRKSGEANYESILGDVARIVEAARRSAARSVNCIMTAAYWLIGRRIVEFEQAGSARADYGTELIKRLAGDLTDRFGRGFGPVDLSQMKKFYLLWPTEKIFQTLSEKSQELLPSGKSQAILQTASEKLGIVPTDSILRSAATCFSLPWSAYVRLLSMENENARTFSETEALRGGWSVRQLARQVNSQFYERTALSRNKAAMLVKGKRPCRETLSRPKKKSRTRMSWNSLASRMSIPKAPSKMP